MQWGLVTSLNGKKKLLVSDVTRENHCIPSFFCLQDKRKNTLIFILGICPTDLGNSLFLSIPILINFTTFYIKRVYWLRCVVTLLNPLRNSIVTLNLIQPYLGCVISHVTVLGQHMWACLLISVYESTVVCKRLCVTTKGRVAWDKNTSIIANREKV